MSNSNIHILIAEDDEVDVMNVKRAFKKCNILNPIHFAKDGREAWEMLNGIDREPLNPMPGIILLDINMPRMNGLEVLQKIRKSDSLKHIPVFILTTSNEAVDKKTAHDLNVAGYIIKPVDFENFVDAVQSLNAFWQLIELPEPTS